jgi:hypothetical protein
VRRSSLASAAQSSARLGFHGEKSAALRGRRRTRREDGKIGEKLRLYRLPINRGGRLTVPASVNIYRGGRLIVPASVNKLGYRPPTFTEAGTFACPPLLMLTEAGSKKRPPRLIFLGLIIFNF